MNIETIRIPSNRVLIKLDPDFDTYHSTITGDNTGIHVAPWGINQASHVAVTGTVVKVPETLIYNGYMLNAMKQHPHRSVETQKEIARLRAESVSYDVPMELVAGLRVYFEYTTRLNAIKEGRAFEIGEDKFILVPYDLLIMAFKPDTDFSNVKVTDVYMLNGFLLIKPIEYAREKSADGITGVKTESDLFLPVPDDAKYVKKGNIWWANILAAGCGVNSYADFPGRGGEQKVDGSKPGQKIAYDSRQQKRLEVEHHRVIFKTHIFYRIQRKDIISWYPDGNFAGISKK